MGVVPNVSDFATQNDFGDLFSSEQERLETFYNWPHDFIDKYTLARTGMWFTNTFDCVRCYFCGVEISRWRRGYGAIAEHWLWSAHCPMLEGRATDNIPIDAARLEQDLNPSLSSIIAEYSTQNNTNLTREANTSNSNKCSAPQEPTYKYIETRIETFINVDTEADPQDLAEAGYFFNVSSACVMCFQCGGNLLNWQYNTNPWEYHALWHSNCQYLRDKKGEDYIENIRTNKRMGLSFKNEDNDIIKLNPEKACKICLTTEYNTIFMPCRHIVACQDCAASIVVCPICRQDLTNIMQIYFS